MAKKDKNTSPKNTKGQESAVQQEQRLLVGIEIDGTQVHVAFVEPRGSIRVEHFQGATPQKALDSALKAIPSRANIVRVAFTGGRQFVRRVEVPRVPDRAMRAALMSIAEDNLPIVPGAASVAGLIIGDPNEQLRSVDNVRGASNALEMVIAAVESDDLDPVWRRLGGRKAPITSSSFLLPADGLYFRVARAVSEVILLEGGVPLVARSLRIGGLDELERRIAESQEASTSFEANATATKSAQEITDEFLDELISEFRKTLIFWKREGTEVPSELIALGAGVNTPTLLSRVAEVGFTILPIPEPRGFHLDIPAHEKPIAFQALASAYSDFTNQPYAILPNPIYDNEKLVAKRNAKRRSIFLVSLIAIVGILALIAFPLIYQGIRQSTTKSDADEAVAALAAKQPIIDANEKLILGETAVTGLETQVPAYSKTLCSVLTSARPGSGGMATYQSVDIVSNPEGPFVTSAAEVVDSSNGFQIVADWLVVLERAASTQKVGTGPFKDVSGKKSFSFKVTYPLSSSYRVPNIISCDGYVDGLSPEQVLKITQGYDANDLLTKMNAKGELIYIATNKKAPSIVTTTTTTTVPTTISNDTTTTTSNTTSTTVGDSQ